MIRAEVLAIGDELLHGGLLDTNSRYIAGCLERVGAAVQRFTVTGDEPGLLRDAIADCCARADVVVATGGLGPTLDDRTRDVIAGLLGAPLELHEPSWAAIQAWLASRGRPVPDSNRRQAMLPAGAVALANPVGTAPGFAATIGAARFYALPGVPREMERMLAEHVLPDIAARPGLRPTAQHWLRILGPSEALLGQRLADFMSPGRDPAVGITASGGLLTVRIVATGASASAAAGACAATAATLRPLLGDWVFAEGTQELPELVLDKLALAHQTIAFAESCTGGLCAARLTDLPGSSAVLRGGVVAYADAAKQSLLGVPAELLAAHGAVSEPVVAAMADGARVRFDADLAVATSGVAGPAGGTPRKPVGMVCFALAGRGPTRAWTLQIPDLGRAFVRDRAVNEVWRALLALDPALTRS